MTKKPIVICDGCGYKSFDESKFKKGYRKLNPSNDVAVKAEHYCQNCEKPEELKDEHPLEKYS